MESRMREEQRRRLTQSQLDIYFAGQSSVHKDIIETMRCIMTETPNFDQLSETMQDQLLSEPFLEPTLLTIEYPEEKWGEMVETIQELAKGRKQHEEWKKDIADKKKRQGTLIQLFRGKQKQKSTHMPTIQVMHNDDSDASSDVGSVPSSITSSAVPHLGSRRRLDEGIEKLLTQVEEETQLRREVRHAQMRQTTTQDEGHYQTAATEENDNKEHKDEMAAEISYVLPVNNRLGLTMGNPLNNDSLVSANNSTIKLGKSMPNSDRTSIDYVQHNQSSSQQSIHRDAASTPTSNEITEQQPCSVPNRKSASKLQKISVQNFEDLKRVLDSQETEASTSLSSRMASSSIPKVLRNSGYGPLNKAVDNGTKAVYTVPKGNDFRAVPLSMGDRLIDVDRIKGQDCSPSLRGQVVLRRSQGRLHQGNLQVTTATTHSRHQGGTRAVPRRRTATAL